MVDKNSLTLLNDDSDPRRVFRAKRGDVRIAILDILEQEGASTGYRLMQRIREKSGDVWRVSAGSIYPTLEKLTQEQYVRPVFRDEGTEFVLTALGQELRKQLANDIERIWDMSPKKNMEKLGSLETELSLLSEAIELAVRTGSGRVSEQIYNEVINLRRRIFGYLSE